MSPESGLLIKIPDTCWYTEAGITTWRASCYFCLWSSPFEETLEHFTIMQIYEYCAACQSLS